MRRTSTPSQPTDEPPTLDRIWSSTHQRAELLRLRAVPTLVVAPHPDDETVVAGGLIAAQRARGVDVQVLHVTDGEHAAVTASADAVAPHRAEQPAALDERVLALELDDDARRRRRRAIECHRSQFHRGGGADDGVPEFTADLLRPLDWKVEYFVAPRLLSAPAADDVSDHVHLATGVPPVTSGSSGVET